MSNLREALLARIAGRASAAAFGILLLGGSAFGQLAAAHPTADALTFDVASVRPTGLNRQKIAAEIQAGKTPRMGPRVDGLRAEYSYMTFRDLVAIAYRWRPILIKGPSWMADRRFDIEARMPEGSSKDDAPRMLQSLLVERFKLATHSETHERSVLALVVAKGGPKLKESTAVSAPFDENAPLDKGESQMASPGGAVRMTPHPDGSSTVKMAGQVATIRMVPETQAMRFSADGMTMDRFAVLLTGWVGGGQPIVDMTGLKGAYHVSVDIPIASLNANGQGSVTRVDGDGDGTAAPEASDPGGDQTVSKSLQTLGLTLKTRKAPVQQLVIDHAEEIPLPN